VSIKEGYKKTEVGIIPKEWEVSKLGAILNIQTGKKNAQDSIENGEYPFFTRSVDTQKINTYSHDTEALFIAGEGNFAVKYYKGKFDIHQRTYMLTSIKDNSVNLKFLQNSIQPRIFRLIATSVGSTVQSLRKPIIENLKIPLPPLKEQKKIADILSTVDEKIAFVDNSIKETETLKKGLMQKLLSEGIGHTEFKDSELGMIPKEWEVVKFKDITKVRQGLQIPISKRKSTKCENCYQYITIQFVKNNKEIEYIQNPQKTVICTEEDILMTRTGNTGIVVTNVSGVFHNNFFLVDFNRDNINKNYLVFCLTSYTIQKEILLKACATTIPDLNHSDFYSIKIALPPIEEQKQIADILSTTDKKLEILKEKKESFEELKKGLMQKLLSGEVRV